MNTWISNVFGVLLNILHIVVIVGLFIFWQQASQTQVDQKKLALIVLSVFLGYIIVIGVLTTFISINERLGKIVELLKEQNSPTKLFSEKD